MATRAPFRSKIEKRAKRSTGRGGVSATPLHVRTSGTAIDEDLAAHARTKLGRKLGKFAPSIERVSVRFDDVNGPRGGVDTVSRIKVVLSALPSVVVEGRGVDARHAFDLASHGVERAVQRSLGRAGITPGRLRKQASARAGRARGLVNPPPPEGSLIGRRVGRSAAQLARTQAWVSDVDTSQPGVSASHRKAGGGSTAARNVKLSTSRASATLEDSATGRPSRKSTRASANRAKSGSKQGRRAKARTHSPKRRAARAQARAAG